MSSAGFLPAEKRTLVYEGGKVDDPRDRGGRTNAGVTQRVYTGWRTKMGRADRDVYLMEPPERDAIYRLQYWDAVRGDELPAGLDGVVFDGAVNSGPSRSIMWVQRALGTVRVDGVLGAATLSAIAAADQADVIRRTCARRLAFVQALSTWKIYGKGWARRIDQVQAAGIAALAGQSAPVTLYADGMHAKASIEDARRRPPTAIVHAVTGGGVVTLTLDKVTSALDPLRAWLPEVGHAVDLLTAAGAITAAAGLGYGAWALRRSGELADALDLAPQLPAVASAPAGAAA